MISRKPGQFCGRLLAPLVGGAYPDTMRFERLDLNLLVALDALIKYRSVTSAAKQLHLTQPALTNALGRLRVFFDDDLLSRSGREMVLTPKARELAEPVHDALTLIRSRILAPGAFNPKEAKRNFRIQASDYTFDVLLKAVFADVASDAPGISFEVIPVDTNGQELLKRGELDLYTKAGLATRRRLPSPNCKLFDDDHAVICWDKSIHAARLDRAAYLDASHVSVNFGGERLPAFTEEILTQEGIRRQIRLTVSSFASLSGAVVGTDRLATLYRRHAEFFARTMPIVVHPMPIAMPLVEVRAHWNDREASDAGLRWVIGQLQRRAGELVPRTLAPQAVAT